MVLAPFLFSRLSALVFTPLAAAVALQLFVSFVAFMPPVRTCGL